MFKSNNNEKRCIFKTLFPNITTFEVPNQTRDFDRIWVVVLRGLSLYL